MNGIPIDIKCEEIYSTDFNSEYYKFQNIDVIRSTSNCKEDNESLTELLSKEFKTSNEESQNEEDIIPERIFIINKNLENVPNLSYCNKNTDKKKITFKTEQYLEKKTKHDKYYECDEFRKIKVMLKDALISFINDKIEKKISILKLVEKSFKILKLKILIKK